MAEQERQASEQATQAQSPEQSGQQQAVVIDVPQAILFSISVLSELAW
jgi:hypothetical protein